MLVFTLLPAGVWTAPANDAVYSGFDPNLIYTSNGGDGSVSVSRSSIDLQAPPTSVPAVLLATTLLPKLRTSVDVSVLSNAGAAEPFRIGVWSPWTTSGYFVVFGPAPANLIEAETMSGGSADATLFGAQVLNSRPLGQYQLGDTYTVTFAVDKTAGTIVTSVSGTHGPNAADSVNSQPFPAIFGNVQVSLAASASPGDGSSHAVLRNFSLVVPHQRLWAVKVDDPIERVILIALALAGLLLIGIKLIAAFRSRTPRSRMTRAPLGTLIAGRGRFLVLGAVAVVVYLAGNALLFPLGSHPFDMGAEKLYAYVARAYGPDQLYYLPNLVSLAKVFGGVPYVETAFPYEPVTAYLSMAIGGLGSVLFAGGGTFSLSDVRLEYLIKAVNVAFGLADGVLIYLILRRFRVSERWSVIATALFLFNPAVWFSMSLWGQTHVVSLFLVLAAVLLAERHMPFWAWLALAAACLTRPQMLVFGLLLGIVFLRKFTWKENLSALSWTMVAAFLLLVPFTLATSPSLPIDIMLNNLHVQEGSGNAAALNTVSQTAYSIWPLVTYLVQGVSGSQRAFVHSSTVLVGSFSYQTVSQVLTLAAMLFVSAVLLFRRRAAIDSGGYVPLVALGIASFLMLLTGLVATHFLLALPFLVLARRYMGTVAYIYVVTIWTVTTFVPMFGGMGPLLTAQDYPVLSPAHSAVTRFFVGLYASDRFITVSVVANVCAVIWLGVLALRRTRPAQPAPA
jgi:Gpi18-like mannosyltransferase